jgi:hypothetical protein
MGKGKDVLVIVAGRRDVSVAAEKNVLVLKSVSVDRG